MTLLALAFLASSALSQAGVPSAVEVEVSLDRDTVRIGEPLALTLTIHPVPTTAEVLFPEFPDSGRLVGLGSPRAIASEPETRSALYELVAWEVGELKVQSAGIRVKMDGTELTIPFPDLTVHVVSVLPGGADVETIAWKPPADVVGGNWSLAEKLAAASLLLALLAGGLAYLRRRGRAKPVPQPEPISPRDKALTGLDVLARCGLIEAGELKGFYSELSLIVRQFLAETEERWGLDLTTLQLMVLVSQDGIAESNVHTLEALLSEADLVKFARLRPDATRAASALTTARTWIDGFERLVPAADVSEAESPELHEGGAEAVLADLDEVFDADDGEPEPAADEGVGTG